MGERALKRRVPVLRVRRGGSPKLSSSLKTDWREDPSVKYRMSSHASLGMTDDMKAALRLVAERLTRDEGRRVSMSEVGRRLLAAGGVK